jgi:hypothetical protein
MASLSWSALLWASAINVPVAVTFGLTAALPGLLTDVLLTLIPSRCPGHGFHVFSRRCRSFCWRAP